MLKVVCCNNSPKKFAKKVVSQRRVEVKKISESLKKIADEEVSRVQALWKDHVEFFDEPVEEAQPLNITTFFEEPLQGDRK